MTLFLFFLHSNYHSNEGKSEICRILLFLSRSIAVELDIHPEGSFSGGPHSLPVVCLIKQWNGGSSTIDDWKVDVGADVVVIDVAKFKGLDGVELDGEEVFCEVAEEDDQKFKKKVETKAEET